MTSELTQRQVKLWWAYGEVMSPQRDGRFTQNLSESLLAKITQQGLNGLSAVEEDGLIAALEISRRDLIRNYIEPSLRFYFADILADTLYELLVMPEMGYPKSIMLKDYIEDGEQNGYRPHDPRMNAKEIMQSGIEFTYYGYPIIAHSVARGRFTLVEGYTRFIHAHLAFMKNGGEKSLKSIIGRMP